MTFICGQSAVAGGVSPLPLELRILGSGGLLQLFTPLRVIPFDCLVACLFVRLIGCARLRALVRRKGRDEGLYGAQGVVAEA